MGRFWAAVPSQRFGRAILAPKSTVRGVVHVGVCLSTPASLSHGVGGNASTQTQRGALVPWAA